MSATKQQEREALAKIKEIVAGLGENSYVGTALQECFSDAEQNIENDWALSMYDRWQYAEQHYETEKAAANEARAEIARLEAENKRLAEMAEREQEWKPYEDDRNVSESEYQALAKTGDTKVLSDAAAAELIHQEFGFDINKIEIVRTVNTYEINRHRQLRKVGELKREALYNATDWNYIRFNVCGWFYEMKNGELRQFID